MSLQDTDNVVRTTVVVEAPAARAFEVFTAEIGTWWPKDHHLISGELEMVFEPFVGGHVYDRAADGTESRWARVLVWEPPARVVFSWDIDVEWKLEPDPARASEVEVRFVAETPERTRIELEHRHLERHGNGWEGMREAFASPDGWPGIRAALATVLPVAEG
jgi:uncharacterized protein YndB with AHSA1/START domain